jgi:prepilin-type N-terminal cleavage/methylation domain-containing protein
MNIFRQTKIKRRKDNGFTLIELLVVMAIIGVIVGMGILLNIQSYFNRAKDVQRRHDLGQLHTAAELYHAEHNYYPPTVTFGSALTENGTVYMTKIGQDPDCSSGSHPCYLYVTDQTTPSQPSWFVAYGKH